jgi:3,4-dihydroxy 2-butanone 4-phosphate synthase/GTP cyclohydrolase II
MKNAFDPFVSDPKERVRRAIEAVAAGRMVVMVDDEDRENEGDLVMAAEKVTPEAVNFMARHARGLICVSLTPERVEQLQLPMMVRSNGSPYGTAFTVSIEARQGVSTGISAADRAHTMRLATDPAAGPAELVSPGHVFPLRAREGGVLVRAGQTEGSVDLARLAGCQPAGVICEIMNEDGSMARLPQLLEFAREHALPVLTVADLIAWRLQSEHIVEPVAEATLRTDSMGSVRAHLFRNRANQLQYLALVKGRIDPADAVLVRVASSNLWADALDAFRNDGGPLLHRSMRMLGEAPAAVVLFILRPFDPDSILRDLFAVSEDVSATRPPERAAGDPYPTAIRDYGLGAQVLRSLGVQRMRLLTNSDRRLPGVEGYGIEVVERIPVPNEPATPSATLQILRGGRL